MTTININLLPEELRDVRGGGARGGGISMPTLDAGAVVPIGIGVVVAAVIAAGPTVFDMIYLTPREQAANEAMDAVKAEINKYQVTLNQLQGINANMEFLRSELTTLQSVAGAGTSWGDILNEMRSQTPANLWFNSLKTDPAKGTISIDGGALDYGSVAYFHRNLDHSDYFYEPVLTSTELQDNKTTGINTVKFSLSVKVRLTKPKT